MLKGYRRRFVAFNMLLVGVVLLIALVYQGVYLYRNAYREMQNTMRLIVEPLGGARMGLFRFDGEDGGPLPEMPQRMDEGFTPREERHIVEEGILAVLYDSENDSYTLLARESFLDEEALDAAVRAAAGETEDFGKLSELGLYYYKESGADDCRIALADTSYLTSRTLKNVLTLAGIYVVTMALVWLISRRLSRLAARPMEDALELERQFVADISHDLKTPITVIMANNSILRSNPDSPPAERAQWLDSTDEAGRDMMHMIDEMLTLSNLESVGRSVVTAPLDFSSAAEKAVLQLESLAYERGVEIASEIAEGVTVRANAEYCARICSGLLENALKYEPVGGRVTLTLGTERKRAVLSVRNQGSFIAPEDLPHIFERFYRSDKARGSRGGHGLGLPIIRQMAELLGGEVTAESSAETGTVFTVTLPLAE